MDRETLFVDIILPLALPNLYTYRVPADWNNDVAIGKRVIVQFGKNKMYTGIIARVHDKAPQQYLAKYLSNILDEKPVVLESQLKLWDWMAAYYMCNPGDVMNAALPSGLRLSSETKIVLSAERELLQVDLDLLSDKEVLILDALDINKVLTIEEAQNILDQKNVHGVIRSLIEKGFVLLQEEVKEKFKAKEEEYVVLTEFADNEENLKTILDDFGKKAFKQVQLLMAYLKLSDRYSEEPKPVLKKTLLKEADAMDSALKSLIAKNIFIVVGKQIWRERLNGDVVKTSELTEHQQEVFGVVQEEFKNKEVLLLQGVTSSGKTELYIKLIEEVIKTGKQVLYLLPEIALTAQIINRLRKNFGGRVGVYHSKYSDNERVEVWQRLLLPLEDPNRFEVVLGARSSVLLPFRDLGLIVVDEEHDSSYKQYDPSPRYNARDTAIYLASLYKAKVVLGSATPSIESFYNAETDKYGFAKLTKRFSDIKMPEILIADVKEEKRKKMMKSHFSSLLLDSISQSLQNKEQVILFQNRRGYVPVIECTSCGWTPQCKQCDVTMTFHKYSSQLRCHYCGHTSKPPVDCPACGSEKLKTIGFGTEKIEEDLSVYFPDKKIGRMDLDTTRTKNAYQKIINDFEEGNIDVLIGTQMVTKGLDFDNVGLVGILNADSLMSHPDFRSHERSFQLMAQVSGRAGRKNKRGKVIIQTYDPSNSLIKFVVDNNYDAMYAVQLAERNEFKYPPFYRLIELTLKHKNHEILEEAAIYLHETLARVFGARLLGPNIPAVSRIKNMYLRNFLLKIEKKSSVQSAKEHIKAALITFKAQNKFRSVIVSIDVDPI